MAGDFYAYLDADPGLARAYGSLNRAIEGYLLKGRVAEAQKARAVLSKLVTDYEKLTLRAPAKADTFIRDVLRATQVRPPTSGNLAGAIRSFPQPTTLPAGAVDIASLDVLEKGAVNPRTGGVYWRAQEYGLPAISGQRPAPGFFQPGSAPPSEDQFRVHPYFQQEPYSKGMPALVRRRALKPRRFLERGTDLFVVWHAKERARINDRALTSLARIAR